MALVQAPITATTLRRPPTQQLTSSSARLTYPQLKIWPHPFPPESMKYSPFCIFKTLLTTFTSPPPLSALHLTPATLRIFWTHGALSRLDASAVPLPGMFSLPHFSPTLNYPFSQQRFRPTSSIPQASPILPGCFCISIHCTAQAVYCNYRFNMFVSPSRLNSGGQTLS